MTVEVDELLRAHRAAQAWRTIAERHPDRMLFAVFDAARFPARLYYDL